MVFYVFIFLLLEKVEEKEKEEEKEVTKPTLSEVKQEEINQRLHTIVVFGIPSQMSLMTLEHK